MPVVGTFQSPNVLAVNPSVPAKTLPEFIAYAKANPGKINYASFGIGSAPHMNGELFEMMTGVKMVHVPYRGSPVPDLLSGQVQAIFSPMPVTIGLYQGRQAARAGGDRRQAFGCACRAFRPLRNSCRDLMPASGTASAHPRARRRKSSPSSIKRSMLCSTTRKPKRSSPNIGGTPIGGTSDAFGKFIAEEIVKWGKVIKTANIKPESAH